MNDYNQKISMKQLDIKKLDWDISPKIWIVTTIGTPGCCSNQLLIYGKWG